MYRGYEAIAAGVLVGMLGVVIGITPLGLGLEESAGLSFLFRLRGAVRVPPAVAVVALDQESADVLNLSPNPLKWPRRLHARLAENLSRMGAAVIVFDVLFSDPTAEYDDGALANAFAAAGNVVLCEHLRQLAVPLDRGGHVHVEKSIAPIDLLASSALDHAPFPLPKIPLRVSQFWSFKTGAGCTPTLPVIAFQVFAMPAFPDFQRLLESVSPAHAGTFAAYGDRASGGGGGRLVAGLREFFEENPAAAKAMRDRLHARTVPVAPQNLGLLEAMILLYSGPDSLFLNFYGPPGTIETVPFHRLVNPDSASAEIPDLKGKAVFVGLSETLRPEQRDGFNTVFSRSDGTDLSGVEIAATAFANLLEGRTIRPLSSFYFLLAVLLFGLVLGTTVFLLPVSLSPIGSAGMGLAWLFVAEYRFAADGTWMPLAVPLLVQTPLGFSARLLWHYLHTHRERENVRKAFGFFLPGKVIDQIILDMGVTRGLASSRQKVFGTVLSSDGEQYTRISEMMHPEELNSFMNRYYESIFPPVAANRGNVSDIIGDSMMAVWASGHPESSLRRDACRAALGVLRAVEEFNRNSPRFKLNTRIGLHFGELILGTVGGSGHYEYRPVGDVVNTASRIENLNKHFNTRILASDAVLDGLYEFLTRELGYFMLSGKARPVTVYELICPIEEADEMQEHLSAIFSEGLKAFSDRRWDGAVGLFQEYQRIAGRDAAAAYYLKKCALYKENPPSVEWDGLVHVSKT